MPCHSCIADLISRRSRQPGGFVGRGAELVRVEIAAGTKAERHAHPHEQVVQVLPGCGMLETAEGCQAFAAGSVFHFPAETWHAATFDEDTVLFETNLPA